MKYVCFLVVLIVLSSCDYFDVKKTSSDAILQEELRTFNWNEVDDYPSFTVCDSVSTKLQKKHCFEQTLISYLGEYLAAQQFVVSKDVYDTVQLSFTISDKGIATILDINVKDETLEQLPQIKNILQRSTDSLPQIFPAIKRGQQVTTLFKLPVVIKVD